MKSERGIGEGGVVAIICAVIVAVVVGTYAVKYFTADVRGKVDANEKIKADGNFRIEAYDRFFDACSSVQAIELQLQAARVEASTNKDERRAGQIRTNIMGLTSARADAVTKYNGDARKSYTAGQFRSSDLPSELPIQPPAEGVTPCTA